ncbi:hypothetical protein HYZ78_00955 [Candidatus Microgenomates bacterium]|nr:hypothetical protein [Candidatus Microgenomates bacterium]
MLRIFKGNWAIAALILLEIFLLVVNFRPGTYLVGWDAVTPEMNFSQNLKRNVFSVWQDYRGLGLVDGMSYAANLPHTVFLWVLHFVLPVSVLRYFFIFLMHFTGGLGMYFLLKKILALHLSGVRMNSVVLAGSLFYMFNLGTIQMFYTPLEAFAVHFAFLPWLIFSLISYLQGGTRKSLAFFALVSFLSLPQAFVPQLFIVSLLLLFLVAVFSIHSVKRLVAVIAVIFSINAFWGLPYAYSALTNSQTILEAKINQMSSGDIFAKNQARGKLSDVLFFKGFMLDVIEYDKSGQNLPVMSEWITHINNIPFVIISWTFLLLSLSGITIAIYYKQKYFYPFVAAFLIAFFILGNDIPVFKQINGFIRDANPILGEAFRFSFTKFATLFAFCYAIFFTYGIHVISGFLKNKFLLSILYSLFSILLIIYSLPAFGGHFLFNSLKVNIGSEYFQTIEFFNNQDKSTRVAALPQSTFWSWRFHNNGYRGSGFIWYGIPQATLDRAFDPWSSTNENYYWELSYAIYSKNLPLFERVLEKYQVNWVLVDGNVINPSSPKALYYDELETLLELSNKIELTRRFGKIKIYKVNLLTPVKNFVYVADNLPTVGPVYKWNNFDAAFVDHGNYISYPATDYTFDKLSASQLLTTNFYYPFRSLFTGRTQDDLEFEVEDREDHYIVRRNLPKGLEGYIVGIPQIDEKELQWVDPKDLSQARVMLEDIYFNGNKVEVRVPKTSGFFSAEIDASNDLGVRRAVNCDKKSNGTVKNEIIEESETQFLRLTAQNATNCSGAFYLSDLPHNLSYLISVQSRNIKGKSPVFWLENLNSRKPDIETLLPSNKKLTTSYFVQPPMESDGLGYTIHIDNGSIGNEESVNDVGEIKVYPLPYKFLTQVVLLRSPDLALHLRGVGTNSVNVRHPNPSVYEVTMKPFSNETMTLVLSQSYNDGWKAYECQISNFKCQILPMIFGEEIKDHVLVNNWSNGWNINVQCQMTNVKCQIAIVYLPQYLEYLGFVMLGVLVSTLIFLQVRGRLSRR